MADVLRSCSKTACRWPAAASLSYRYATRQVWLLDLSPVADPSLYDLCPHHADALVVPNGWERVDDRTVQEVMVEPSASDRAAAAGRRSATAADLEPIGSVAPPRPLVAAGRNRYADLVAQLPQLAAEIGAPGGAASIGAAGGNDGPADDSDSEPPLPPTTITAAPKPEPSPLPAQQARPAAPAPTAPIRPATSAPAARPMPSRELAPLPPAEHTWNAEAIEPPLPAQDLPPQPLPGQLAIPVDDLSGDGVVVPFELAGGRRRSRT